MPWSQTTPMKERVRFIADFEGRLFTLTELCQRYRISRKTGYKWIGRFDEEGPKGLADRSRTPRTCPHCTDPDIVERLIDARLDHPRWGARKLIPWLAKRNGHLTWPSPSTAADILKRFGLVENRRRKRRLNSLSKTRTEPHSPNQLWTADFKGQFRTRDGIYCYPLTVADGFSRYLLACRSLASTRSSPTRSTFTDLFRHYGLPEAIRSDNGTPFAAATAIGRLSRLSVWWIRLGIRPELTKPSHPEQNGAHERMHRTLKADTTRPPAGNRGAQQRKFDSFRQEYNHERPHEALDQKTPASLYVPSHRPFPNRLPQPEYPGHFEVRRVSRNGGIRWKTSWVNISHSLLEEYVGLEEVDDGVWSLYFGPVLLGRFHEDDLTLHGARLD
jgi:transposase InsO family protein